jgi:hypothetical protein
MIMNIEKLTIQINEKWDVYKYKESNLEESIVSLHKRDTSATDFKSDNSSNIGIALPTQKKIRKKRGFGRFFLIAGVRPFMRILNTGRNHGIRRFLRDA